MHGAYDENLVGNYYAIGVLCYVLTMGRKFHRLRNRVGSHIIRGHTGGREGAAGPANRKGPLQVVTLPKRRNLQPPHGWDPNSSCAGPGR